MTIRWTTLAVFAFVALAGCSKDRHDRQAVSGSVKLKGKPVVRGQLFFEPAAGQQVATTTTVIDGQFQIPKAEGLSPGKYTWRMTVWDREATAGGPTPRNLIPDKENGKTFEIKKDAENKLDIDIP